MKRNWIFLTIFMVFSVSSLSFSNPYPQDKAKATKILDPRIQEIAQKALLAYIKGDKFRTMKYPFGGKTYEPGLIDFGPSKKKTKQSSDKVSGDKVIRDFFKENGEEALISYLKTLEVVDKSTPEDKKEGFFKIEFLGNLPGGTEGETASGPVVSVTLEPINEVKIE